MATMRLYLASTSPARMATLRAAGIEPIPHAPGVDEDAAVEAEQERLGRALSATELVQHLARLKAEAVAASVDDLDGFVLGGDSAFEIGGTIHGKPHTVERARERWHAQRGRSGVLHSGHWLVDARKDAARPNALPEDIRSGLVEGASRTLLGVGVATQATVHFAADLQDAEIEAYLASGEPLAVAGAFTIDSLGGPFIDWIEGDPSTVIGVSLPAVRRLVRALGGSWTALWNLPR